MTQMRGRKADDIPIPSGSQHIHYTGFFNSLNCLNLNTVKSWTQGLGLCWKSSEGCLCLCVYVCVCVCVCSRGTEVWHPDEFTKVNPAGSLDRERQLTLLSGFHGKDNYFCICLVGRRKMVTTFSVYWALTI